MIRFPFSDAISQDRIRLRSHGPVRFITFSPLDSYPQVSALMTLRSDAWPSSARGADLLAAAGPSVAHVLGVPFQNLIAGTQVHGTHVFSFPKNLHVASPQTSPRLIPSADGLLTDVRRMALIVVTADCLPVFLFHPEKAVIGLLHCGRQGTFDDVIGVGIEKMKQDFAADAADCLALIGPSVGPCCYEIDLWGANEHRLKELGVSNVLNCRVCTKCNNDLFYSYRAEGDHAGRMISAIALK